MKEIISGQSAGSQNSVENSANVNIGNFYARISNVSNRHAEEKENIGQTSEFAAMRIFISWSGEKSRTVAEALNDWLPCIYQTCQPWLSSSSIQPGGRWAIELAEMLEKTELGVLCLTKENLNSPWILFEAGALSKSVAGGRVVPFLIDLQPTDLKGPLAQFQAVAATKEGTKSLLRMIADVNPNNFQSDKMIETVFERWWPQLDHAFAIRSTKDGS
jgi:hypothetical protein